MRCRCTQSPRILTDERNVPPDGDKWKFARSTLSPYFTAKYVNNYISMFDNKANELIAEIDKAKGALSHPT
jgi:cytochrome P450